jgi:hypothetical protein
VAKSFYSTISNANNMNKTHCNRFLKCLTALFCLILPPSVFFAQNDYAKLIEDENVPRAHPDISDDRYNRDNIVYKTGREFIYHYIVLEGKDSFKVRFGMNEFDIPKWSLVTPNDTASTTVATIGFAIQPRRMDTQTFFNFNYRNAADVVIKNNTGSGLIENKHNVWLHPPRDEFFEVVEFNAFPYIKAPYQIGTKWESGVSAGYFASYERFNLKWEGVLVLHDSLGIVDKTVLETPLGKLDCFVIKAQTTSKLTNTKTVFYFNEKYGFVKIIYHLFDGKTLILDLIKMVEAKKIGKR